MMLEVRHDFQNGSLLRISLFFFSKTLQTNYCCLNVTKSNQRILVWFKKLKFSEENIKIFISNSKIQNFEELLLLLSLVNFFNVIMSISCAEFGLQNFEWYMEIQHVTTVLKELNRFQKLASVITEVPRFSSSVNA